MTALVVFAAAYAAFMVIAACQFRRAGIHFKPRAYLILATAAVSELVCALRVHALFEAIALAVAAAASVTDCETGYIPDSILVTAALAMSAALYRTVYFRTSVEGFVIAAAAMALLYAATRTRGLGFGDVKLAACCGAGAGIAGALVLLQSAFIAGGAVAAFRIIVLKADRKQRMIFGPFLASGLLVAFLVR